VDKAPKPKRGNKGFGAALAGVLGAALLIFALSGGSKSGRLSGSNGGNPAAQATNINQGAPVPAGPAVKVSWRVPNNVRLQDIIQFQIFRSDVVGGTTVGTTGGTGTTIAPGTPVGVASPGETVFYDTNQARDITYFTLTPGTEQPGGSTTTTLTTTTATGLPGVVAGRPVTYRITMIYRRLTPQNGGTQSGGSTAGPTAGTTAGTTANTTSGTGNGTEAFYSTPVTVTGLVTPLEAPIANSPQGGTTVDPASVSFDIQSVQGANQYMIELSADPSFRSNVKQVILPIQPTSSRSGSVSANNVNLSNLFSNYHGTLYWHAGARNSLDSPGPDPGRFNAGSGDRRWVYSDFESLTIP
jgi:hypothetical protein